MVAWQKIQIPEKPTDELVHVLSIAPGASEKTVRDFFQFCGKIKEFEMQTSDDGNSKEALVWFERGSAAKTACMLSNAMIADQHIQVKYHFDGQFDSPTPSTPQQEQQAQEVAAEATRSVSDVKYISEDQPPKTGEQENKPINQEDKPRLSIVAEMVAAGYILSEQIQKRAQGLDAKYGVSTTVQSYWGKLDGTLKIQEKAQMVDDRLHIKQAVDNLVATAASYGNQAMQTQTGQRATEAVRGIHQESLKIAEEKKAKQQQQAAEQAPADAAPSSSSSQQ
jgi:hypothetical protein